MRSGDTIGKYRLVRQLGRGGMGEVWLATASGHGGFTKTVVLKTLLPEVAHDPLFIEMLAHEARLCAKLSHPNLIEVFDFSEHDGIYLLAMEHVAGEPLHHILRTARARGWQIPPWFSLRVAWECCRGLECAHDQGVIHCDLSPSNVMVAFTGVTKILDFGVAHSTARGPTADRLKGKFSYMAPERIRSLATDRRTDIYALGVMLYLLFTGQLPFQAASDQALLHDIVHVRPVPPGELCTIDPRIEQLILRAMQPDPRARYQTIGELIAELSPCIDAQLGIYGQHDVASFVRALFHTRHAGVGDTTRTAALLAGDEIEEIDSFDIEVESSVFEIPHEPPSTSSASSLHEMWSSRARASPTIAPLARPLTTVFDYREARTSVQNLFGDGDGDGDRASRHSTSRAPALASWPWPSSRTKSD
jgi:serine/threonine protein kinase